MTAKKEVSTDDKKAAEATTKSTADSKKELSTGYKVADNVTLTSKRGMIKAGAEVQSSDLSGGQASIDALLKSRKIVKS